MTQEEMAGLLRDDIKVMYYAFKQKADTAGLPFKLTSTGRRIEEQIALYVQGRMALNDVNAIRASIGLPPIPPKDNNQVTWTLRSNHVISVTMPLSRAFDVVLLKDGIPDWCLKIDVNENQIPDYKELALLGQKVGLVNLGLKIGKDWAHYEL